MICMQYHIHVLCNKTVFEIYTFSLFLFIFLCDMILSSYRQEGGL